MNRDLLISTEKHKQYDMQCITNYYNSNIHNHITKQLQILSAIVISNPTIYEIAEKYIIALDIAIDVCRGLDAQKIGYWIYDNQANNDGGKCSYCGKGSIIRTPYCMWCGAKMINSDYDENQKKINEKREV